MGMSREDFVSDVKMPKQLKAPARLTPDEVKRFNLIQRQLLAAVDGVSRLDTETLARYCETETAYLAADRLLRRVTDEAENASTEELPDWMDEVKKATGVRDKHLQTLITLGRELKMTVGSRSSKTAAASEPQQKPKPGGLDGLLSVDFRRGKAGNG